MSIAAARGLPGIRASQQLALQQQQHKAAEQAKLIERATSGIDSTIETAAKIMENYLNGGEGRKPTDEAVAKVLAPLEAQVSQTAGPLSQMTGINHQAIAQGKFQAIGSMVTPEQKRQQEALDTKAGITAVAEGNAEVVNTVADTEAKAADAERTAERNWLNENPTYEGNVPVYNPQTGQTEMARRVTSGEGTYLELGGKPMTAPWIEADEVSIGIQGSDLTKPTENLLQKGIVEIQDVKDLTQKLKESFDPSFLNVVKRAGINILAEAEKYGFELDPEQKQLVERMAVFVRRNFKLLNTYVRQISGAQVTDKEAERILNELPNFGLSPTEYEAAMNDVMRDIALAQARKQWFLRKGITLEAPSIEDVESGKAESLDAPIGPEGRPITLESMEGIIKDRAREIHKERGNISVQEAFDLAEEEFGI